MQAMMHDGSASRQGVYRRASTTRSPAVTVIQPHERVGAYFTLSTTPHGFGPTTDALPLTGLPEYLSKRRRTCPESFMYFLIRRRVQKLAKRGDQRISRTRFLLSTRGVEIDPRYHIVSRSGWNMPMTSDKVWRAEPTRHKSKTQCGIVNGLRNAAKVEVWVHIHAT
ncbi:hypothetical protein BC826DRAFT_170273 [Russula brevipes]|nr:hypothetical protein BC826DRAFT_170273 [Russula brevipes]